jgi:pyrimidine operon attenuation protein/uracil phosphoribosyltransferase
MFCVLIYFQKSIKVLHVRGVTVANLIEVELSDGTLCRMAPKALDMFLVRDDVSRFRRSDGWVVVGVDPLRDLSKRSAYNGVERRLAA